MMEIDGFKITVKRNGEKTRLTLQGGTHGVAVNMNLAELQSFALLLASECGKRLDEQLESEGALPQAERTAV
jgi:hypothetical protein